MPLPENTPDNRAHDITGADFRKLEASVEALRKLVNAVMAALLILAVSLFAFVLRELKFVRRQLAENSRFVEDYRKNWEPKVTELHSKLLSYSTSHPDFTPIFVKYFGSTNGLLPGAPAPTTRTQPPPPGPKTPSR
jgi:hypothetical protein